MRFRPGRKNPRNLYLQLGAAPSDDDPCIGLMIDPGTAALVSEAFLSLEHLERIRMNVQRRTER